ncbi:hypothetical protein LCGC14_2111570 [marine sediment metagenome]|uniref:Uncharacterized protein n=1 Tax=marine sediment metagenome TaxID=412755 RepID=A0A0F9GK56_9ZZZZ
MARILYEKIADAKPPVPPTDGVHPLRIMKATHKKSKSSGKMMTEVMISVEDDEEALPIYQYLMDPISQAEFEATLAAKPDSGFENMSDGEKLIAYNKSENNKLLNAQRLLVAFDIEFDETGFDTDSFVSHTASLQLKSTTDDQNRVSTNIVFPQVAV